MVSSLACYYDFTCGYSYRAWSWLERLKLVDGGVEIAWLPFVLKEVNRSDSEPSFLAGPRADRVAVLSLALAEALTGLPGAEAYRSALFDAMHKGEERPARDEILAIAARAGLDIDGFFRDEATWVEAVRQSHIGAEERWGAFGTPTIILEDKAAMYMKLKEVPPQGDLSLWEAITSITLASEVTELKRPERD